MIEVRLFATFREGREKIQYLDPQNFSEVSQVLDYLKIPHEEVAICLVNGMHSKLDKELKDEDVLALFPPVGGG
ncbi:MoaD/ThiS family protein [Proteocatella sphenisci]|uniref:MoaD/ThiS family protein n=1 Tax=Proteocatella sphenisci TaxID=181070 RepID=UPI0004B3EC0A|nr:MoaD/ThiS family protein [Proteocatella sphenisci]